MPELIEGSEHLVAFLRSAGYATATGMGLVGLSWQELKAWAEFTGLEDSLSYADRATIFSLSRIYAAEIARASKKGAKPPYEPVNEKQDQVRRQAFDRGVENLFMNMYKRQQENKNIT